MDSDEQSHSDYNTDDLPDEPREKQSHHPNLRSVIGMLRRFNQIEQIVVCFGKDNQYLESDELRLCVSGIGETTLNAVEGELSRFVKFGGKQWDIALTTESCEANGVKVIHDGEVELGRVMQRVRDSYPLFKADGYRE